MDIYKYNNIFRPGKSLGTHVRDNQHEAFLLKTFIILILQYMFRSIHLELQLIMKITRINFQSHIPPYFSECLCYE